ncbi:MAG TPA: TIGR01212 family radical SAM protein [Candidatus Merdisoma merdipullorum]|nr:TIGR01212 family radical SAM protein [Candidatus Merdisoma merdipullorum]
MTKSRFYSLNDALRERFGEKLYKLTLNGGCTCPNRDGTLGARGCIFCSEGGSGEFAGSPELSVSEQIEEGKRRLAGKRPVRRYIAYFQAYTNTYGPEERLRRMFTEAISHPEIAVLSIATRPDCLGDEVLSLLEELNRIKPVWVELGLQTIHEKTAAFIRRGYPLSVFDQAVKALTQRGIETIVHTILGLPGETPEMMLDTVRYVNLTSASGIKLQLLHILKNTDLADYYVRTGFSVLSMEEYVDLVIRCLEICRPDLVIHRLTGDGPGDLLIAPEWSRAKRQVLNAIHKEMKKRETYQGRLYESKSNPPQQ